MSEDAWAKALEQQRQTSERHQNPPAQESLSALPPLPPWPSNFYGHSQGGPWFQVPSSDQGSSGPQRDYSQWGL